MRYYKIKIDNKPFLELSEKNPNAPRITFNLKQFGGSEIPNNIITISNVGIEFLGNLDKLKGKKFELYAGLKNRTLLNAMGVTSIENNLIAYGYIAECNMNPNYSPTENQIFFILRPSSKLADKPFLLECKEGDMVKEQISKALKGIYTESKVKTIGLPLLIGQKETIKIHSLSDIQGFAKKHKASIYRGKDGFIVDDEKPTIPMPPRVIKAVDLLEMPTQIRTSTIQLSLGMRGDLELGGYIMLPPSLFATIPLDVKFILAKPKIYIQGVYRIVKIWHIGDSRGKGAQSWSTNIEAIKAGL